jgi:hypothetical protein
MSKAISQPERRTYFNNPLIEETLKHLPAAVAHPSTTEFRAYLTEHLHYSGKSTRERFAQYIAQRFSTNGLVNLDLARAIATFGSGRVGREILCFEMLRAVPLFQESSSLWLAEQPPEGAPRQKLLEFLEPRLQGRSTDKVAQALAQAWRELGKMRSPKPALYVPVWAEPPVEAFLYALAALFPERAMVRVDAFSGLPTLRAMLWPRACLEPLLQEAHRLGHVSKISELDQYHQFTLADSGAVRMGWLLDADGIAVALAAQRAGGAT